ncbi:ATP-grasp domain-containing protein [Halobacillus seohaensis]|uniref:ATP-grasp domain-containing protein n=1 Tax=Halobacillus seohaensis TaxID=447421 RepID=A0ABW2ELJ2_9BACI
MEKKIINILLTGIGGPTPRSLARALKADNTVYKYNIVGVDCNPLASGLYDNKYVDKSFLVPKFDDENYWDVINEIVHEQRIDAAIVQPEIEVEGWALYAKNNKLPCPVLLPPYEIVPVLKDKAKMNELLKETNLIPKSVEISRFEYDTKELEETVGYPYWIRSATGSSGLGSLKIDNHKKLEGWMLINENVENFTVSEFLEGRNLACKLLFDEGTLIRAMCGERVNYIMSKVTPSGITGNTSFGRLLNNKEAINVSMEALNIIAEKTGVELNGLFTVDLKEDIDGNPRITEINVRNVAFNSVFQKGGINIAEEMLLLLFGEQGLIKKPALHEFGVPFVFIRDVDCEPIVLEEDRLLGQ